MQATSDNDLYKGVYLLRRSILLGEVYVAHRQEIVIGL